VSDELGSNSASKRPSERSDSQSNSQSKSAAPKSATSEDIDLENYSIPGLIVEDDPIAEDLFTNGTSANDTFAQQAAAANAERFYAPRPALSRGFDANAYRAPAQPTSQSTGQPATAYPGISPRTLQPNSGVSSSPPEKKSRWSWLLPGRKSKQSAPPAQLDPLVPLQRGTDPSQPYPPEWGAIPGLDGDSTAGTDSVSSLHPVVTAPKIWEKQPYRAIAYTSAIAGTLTAAWLFGILAAQLIPGKLQRPPLQESVLRKSSRLTSGLWHLPQLWQTPTAETRIEAIPLPETGPILKPIELSPLERQPLIDELNTVETELLTLERRIQTLEKQLGKPPYQDADLESRMNTLRDTIDPPIRTEATPQYKPTARDPQTALLSVAKHKITLPSDALFAPGDSNLKDSELLNQALDQLINYPQATVIVRSYSDDQAGAIATQKYTLAQANTLSEYLNQSLPEGYRWITIGGGQSQPIEPNDSAINRQRNRRIEILIDTR